MTKIYPRLLAMVLILGSAGAAQSPKQRPPELSACGPADAKLKVELSKGSSDAVQPDEGWAKLFVIQVPVAVVHPNCGILWRYAVDGKWAGGNCNKSYFAISLLPGEHHLCGERQNKVLFHEAALALKTLNLEPNKTYYLKALVNVQAAGNAAIEFQQLDPDEAKLLLSNTEEAHLK